MSRVEELGGMGKWWDMVGYGGYGTIGKGLERPYYCTM